MSSEEVSTDRLTQKPWPPPAVSSGAEQMAVVLPRHRLVDEADAALVEQLAVLVLGIDDDEAAPCRRRNGARSAAACLCRSSRSRSSRWARRCGRARARWSSVRSPRSPGTGESGEGAGGEQRRRRTLIARDGADGKASAAIKRPVGTADVGRRRGPTSRRAPAGRAMRPRAPSSAPGASSSASSRSRSYGPGHRQRAGLGRRKAEAAIIGGVADQQDGAVAAPRAPRGSPAASSAAPMPRPAAIGIDRERAEQQRRPARTRRHVPQAHRADQAAVLARDEREAGCRQRPSRSRSERLGEPAAAEGDVEQRSRAPRRRPAFPDGW